MQPRQVLLQIKIWKAEADKLGAAYGIEARKYRLYDDSLLLLSPGIAVVILVLTTLAGAPGILSPSANHWAIWITAGVSAGILAISVLQGVFKFGARAAEARRAETEFGMLSRKFGQCLLEDPDPSILTDLRKRMDSLERISPSISNWILALPELEALNAYARELHSQFDQEVLLCGQGANVTPLRQSNS